MVEQTTPNTSHKNRTDHQAFDPLIALMEVLQHAPPDREEAAFNATTMIDDRGNSIKY